MQPRSQARDAEGSPRFAKQFDLTVGLGASQAPEIKLVPSPAPFPMTKKPQPRIFPPRETAPLGHKRNSGLGRAWWRRGQLPGCGHESYLQDNPLAARTACPEHIKNRPASATGGSSNTVRSVQSGPTQHRLIQANDLDMNLPVRGLGPMVAPGVLRPPTSTPANADLSRQIQQDAEGMRQAFFQSSSPSRPHRQPLPRKRPARSKRAVDLGYTCSAHALWRRLRQPRPDRPWGPPPPPPPAPGGPPGDARGRNRPLATSWHINKFLKPDQATAAVLPVLHLTATKIAKPALLAPDRQPEPGASECGATAESAVRPRAWKPERCTRRMAAAMGYGPSSPDPGDPASKAPP